MSVLNKYKFGGGPGVDIKKAVASGGLRVDGASQGSNLPITDKALDATKTPTGLSTMPSKTSGSTQVSMETPKMGSLVDFQRVMRAVAQDTYEHRQKKEGKITKGQFDPSKVSGSIFRDIMQNVEQNRGGSVSKIYAAGMDAGTEMIKQSQEDKKLEEQKRQFDIEQNLKKEQYYAEHPELNYGFTPGSGMRTDRHNNPAAFTVDIARQAGLVEGVDFVRGDAFPDNPNLFTAKLLGNPIETTIRVIDKIGFMTQGGQNRWTYTDTIPGANNNDWQKLGFQEKAQVIKDMYRHEGGNGSLFGISMDDKPLTPQQATSVRSIAGAFDNEATVKRFGQLQEANSFVQALNPNTTSASDDQGLVYAFAKAMDPDSAVREGEYATVQKYAQSWASTFSFDAQRVVDGVEFLTPEARINLKNAINTKYMATKKSYDKVYEEYGRRINETANVNNGTKYLTQYALPTSTEAAPSKQAETFRNKYNY